MTLDNVKKGQYIQILHMPQGDIRAQALRLGLCEGAQLQCVEALHGGPVVLCDSFQEIAVGHRIARQITVQKM